MPYVFPRAPREIARGGAQSRSARPYPLWRAAHDRAGSLLRYFAASTLAGKNATAKAMAPFLARATAEHLEVCAAGGGRGAPASRRLDQGVPERARVGSGEQGGRGAQALRHQPGHARSGRSRGARAASERRRDRRRALRRPVVDSRPAGAGAELCGALHEARRPDGNGRCAHARSGRLGMDGQDRLRPARRPRRRDRARAVVGRNRALARPSAAVFRQARLSHALRGEGERRPHPSGARSRARLSRHPDGARACA